MKDKVLFIVLCSLCLALISCEIPTLSSKPIYNSEDITRLPCEGDERTFFPIEFDAEGKYRFPEQVELLKSELKDRKPSDLYIFVHGWDKPPSAAETDYKDFICRILPANGADPLDTHLVVGVFWPSIFLPNLPSFVPQFSYWAMRNRADKLSSIGFKYLLSALGEGTLDYSHYWENRLRVHIIGHSFGGRIVAKGLRSLYSDFAISENCDNKARYAESNRLILRTGMMLFLSRLDIILVNAAASHEELHDLEKPLDDYEITIFKAGTFTAKLHEQVGRLSGKELEEFLCLHEKFEGEHLLFIRQRHTKIYNVYSRNDWATGVLYPLVSFKHALGASPVEPYPIDEADDSGRLTIQQASEKRIWNIDASNVIKSHTDIYKGRVALLIRQIIDHSMKMEEAFPQ